MWGGGGGGGGGGEPQRETVDNHQEPYLPTPLNEIIMDLRPFFFPHFPWIRVDSIAATMYTDFVL